MHTLKHHLAAAALAAAALALTAVMGSAHAATVSQSLSFSSSTNVAGSGSVNAVGSDFFKASFNPFDSTLGTLTAFSITWSAGASGVFDTVASGGGYMTFGGGGSYAINGSNYSGDSIAGSTSGGAGQTGLTAEAAASDLGNWLAAQAGQTYNPQFLATMTGSNPVQLAFVSPVAVTYNNLLSGSVNVTGKVVLDYIYTPAVTTPASDVPEPTSLALALAALLGAGAVRRRQG